MKAHEAGARKRESGRTEILEHEAHGTKDATKST